MRRITARVIAVCLGSVIACQSNSSTADSASKSPCAASGLSVSMVLLNLGQPFVSKPFAQRLGRLVIEEKYRNFLSVRGSPVVVDKGEVWLATFEVTGSNDRSRRLLLEGVVPGPRHLTISIRKTNGEILAIS